MPVYVQQHKKHTTHPLLICDIKHKYIDAKPATAPFVDICAVFARLNMCRLQWEKSRVHPYDYYDSASSSLDMAGMLAGLEAAPEGSAVLLHMCAQNPTGLDPTTAQWEEVLAVAQRKGHLCLFDGAYQVRVRACKVFGAGGCYSFVCFGLAAAVK